MAAGRSAGWECLLAAPALAAASKFEAKLRAAPPARRPKDWARRCASDPSGAAREQPQPRGGQRRDTSASPIAPLPFRLRPWRASEHCSSSARRPNSLRAGAQTFLSPRRLRQCQKESPPRTGLVFPDLRAARIVGPVPPAVCCHLRPMVGRHSRPYILHRPISNNCSLHGTNGSSTQNHRHTLQARFFILFLTMLDSA